MPYKNVILVLLYGDLPSDPRVRKELITLQKISNIELNVICLTYKIYNKFDSKKLIFHPLYHKIESTQRISFKYLMRFLIFSIIIGIKISMSNNLKIIHAHDFTALIPALIIKMLFPKTKVIYDAHELFPWLVKEYYGNVAYIISRILESIMILFTSVVIGVSFYQIEIMKRLYKIKKTVIIKNLPLFEEYKNEAEEKGKIHNLNIEGSYINAIYAGAIVPNRGYLELLEGISYLTKKYKNLPIKLYIAGDGPLKEVFLRRTKELHLGDFINYLGFLPSKILYEILRQMDIGISLLDPSASINNKIGFPNKIPEYLLSGLIVLTTDLPNLKKFNLSDKLVIIKELSPRAIAEGFIDAIEKIKNKNKLREKNEIKKKELIWEEQENLLKQIYLELILN